MLKISDISRHPIELRSRFTDNFYVVCKKNKTFGAKKAFLIKHFFVFVI